MIDPNTYHTPLAFHNISGHVLKSYRTRSIRSVGARFVLRNQDTQHVVYITTYLGSHHIGRNGVKRLLHLVSTRSRNDMYSMSSEWCEFFLTASTEGLAAKWMRGEGWVVTLFKKKRMKLSLTRLIKAPIDANREDSSCQTGLLQLQPVKYALKPNFV